MPNLGKASLRVALRGERSVVSEQYGQAPLLVHRALYLDDQTHPTVFLRSPSSGLLDGDEHQIHIVVETGASLEVRTQADLQIYPGRSRQQIIIDVHEEASLVFLPHQLILGTGSELQQSIRLHCANGGRVLFSETWCAGRISMRETWQFSHFHNDIRIHENGKLVYKEHYQLQPQSQPLPHQLCAGGSTHFRTLFAVGQPLPSKLTECQSAAWTMMRANTTVCKQLSRKRFT